MQCWSRLVVLLLAVSNAACYRIPPHVSSARAGNIVNLYQISRPIVLKRPSRTTTIDSSIARNDDNSKFKRRSLAQLENQPIRMYDGNVRISRISNHHQKKKLKLRGRSFATTLKNQPIRMYDENARIRIANHHQNKTVINQSQRSESSLSNHHVTHQKSIEIGHFVLTTNKPDWLKKIKKSIIHNDKLLWKPHRSDNNYGKQLLLLAKLYSRSLFRKRSPEDNFKNFIKYSKLITPKTSHDKNIGTGNDNNNDVTRLSTRHNEDINDVKDVGNNDVTSLVTRHSDDNDVANIDVTSLDTRHNDDTNDINDVGNNNNDVARFSVRHNDAINDVYDAGNNNNNDVTRSSTRHNDDNNDVARSSTRYHDDNNDVAHSSTRHHDDAHSIARHNDDNNDVARSSTRHNNDINDVNDVSYGVIVVDFPAIFTRFPSINKRMVGQRKPFRKLNYISLDERDRNANSETPYDDKNDQNRDTRVTKHRRQITGRRLIQQSDRRLLRSSNNAISLVEPGRNANSETPYEDDDDDENRDTPGTEHRRRPNRGLRRLIRQSARRLLRSSNNARRLSGKYGRTHSRNYQQTLSFKPIGYNFVYGYYNY